MARSIHGAGLGRATLLGVVLLHARDTSATWRTCSEPLGSVYRGGSQYNCQHAGLTGVPEPFLPDTTRIVIQNNLITEISTGFANLTMLWVLNAAWNEITLISPGALEGCSQLRVLRLSRNRIASVPAALLDETERLASLSLDSNPLTTLPPTLLRGAPALTQLHVFRCDLSSFPDGLIRPGSGAGLLRTIKAYDNALTVLPDLSHLRELEVCWFYGNRIAMLPSDRALANSTRLQNLHLGYNAISAVTVQTFAGLVMLETLWLYGNRLSALPGPATFSDLRALTKLGLHNNRLADLPTGIFDPLVALEELWLHSNRITQLQSGIFAELRSITMILAYSNRITNIADDTFTASSQLDTLYLNNNAITAIGPAAFASQNALRVLWLSNNELVAVPDGWLFGSRASMTDLKVNHNHLLELPDLTGMSGLRRLDLDSNHISAIAPEETQSLGNLSVLRMANNDLRWVPEAISHLPAIVELYLAYNRITQLAETVLEVANSRLTTLHLGGNPLHCEQVAETEDTICRRCVLGFTLYAATNTSGADNSTASASGDRASCVRPSFGTARPWIPDSLAHNIAPIAHLSDYYWSAPPELTPKQTAFVGYSDSQFGRIRYKLRFGPEDEHIAGYMLCGESVLGTTAGKVDTVTWKNPLHHPTAGYHSDAAAGVNPATMTFNLFESPEVMYRFDLVEGGEVSFDSCESAFATSIGIYRLNDSAPATVGLIGHHLTDAAVTLPSEGGCGPLNSAAKVTRRLPPGRYALMIQATRYESSTAGQFVIHMQCLANATTKHYDPGGFVVNPATGAIAGSPTREGSFDMALFAEDGAGQQIILRTWSFDVVVQEQLTWANTSCGAEARASLESAVEAVPERTDLGSTTVLSWFPVELSCSKTDAFDNLRASHLTQTHVKALRFMVLVRHRENGTEADVQGDYTAINPDTGRVLLNLTAIGDYLAELVATSGSSEVVLGSVNLTVRNADTSNPANGPNGRGCGEHGIENDAVKQDDLFSCTCQGQYTGDNCDVPASNFKGADGAAANRTAMMTGTAVGSLALVGLLAILFASKVQQCRRKFAAAHLTEIASAGMGVSQPRLDAAIFEALDLKLDHLLLKLLSSGADASLRHPVTHQLAHYIVLSRHNLHIELLRCLFARSPIIDHQIGTVMNAPEKFEAVRTVFSNLATEMWRGDNGTTILHSVVNACRHGSITSDQAVQLSKALLISDPSLRTAEDRFKQTPGDYAMGCEDALELELLLTVVVHQSFQLLKPAEYLYVSPTALVMEARFIAEDTDGRVSAASRDLTPSRRLSSFSHELERGQQAIVIKLMSDGAAWRREVECRQAMGSVASSIEAAWIPIFAIASTDPNVPQHVGALPVIGWNKADLTARTPDECSYTCRMPTAKELEQRFPFALAMERAERSLLEIIANERLAAEPLEVIRVIAHKVAKCIDSMHNKGVIHGDIKPRNVVRVCGNDIRLIDLDMSFCPPVSEAPSSTLSSPAPTAHADAVKIQATDAYMSPELLTWSVKTAQNEPCADPALIFSAAVGLDTWSFGCTLFEMVTGTPLIHNSYDAATGIGKARLLQWKGLLPSEEQQIHRLHGYEATATLIDVLQWLLDRDVDKRPKSMAAVLNHAFFAPIKGAMRESFAFDQIRLALKRAPEDWRPCKRVMISYAWADSSFVVKLAHRLAPLVEGMWLDRLGGEDGMDQWVQASMERGVKGADVVIAVVSPAYTKSTNCGREMELTDTHKKDIIPIVLGLPFEDWCSLKKIGNTELKTQFHDAATGDCKLFVDFTKSELFEVTLHQELLPQLAKKQEEQMPNVGCENPAQPGPTSAVELAPQTESKSHCFNSTTV